MNTEIDVEKCLHGIRDNRAKYAKAKGEAKTLDHYRKALVSSLKIRCQKENPDIKSNADREDWARAHNEYATFLKGYEEAIILEANLLGAIESAKLHLQLYQTQRADLRGEKRAYNVK